MNLILIEYNFVRFKSLCITVYVGYEPDVKLFEYIIIIILYVVTPCDLAISIRH